MSAPSPGRLLRAGRLPHGRRWAAAGLPALAAAVVVVALVALGALAAPVGWTQPTGPHPMAHAMPSPPGLSSEADRFLAENSAAMDRMMADMAVPPTGDVDRDFAAMMIPHHQGAIDMAQALLRHGRNESLRRIAQQIIVEQQQEIAAMRRAVDAQAAALCTTPRSSPKVQSGVP